MNIFFRVTKNMTGGTCAAQLVILMQVYTLQAVRSNTAGSARDWGHVGIPKDNSRGRPVFFLGGGD